MITSIGAARHGADGILALVRSPDPIGRRGVRRGMAGKSYYEKLRDPRWQRRRLEVMQRDEFTCQCCFDSESTLNVHHRLYIKGREPWDYPLAGLVTLCESCHSNEANVSEALHRFVMALFPFNYSDSAVFEEWAHVIEKAVGPDGLRGNTPDHHDLRNAIAEILRLHVAGDPIVKQLSARFREFEKGRGDI